MSESDIIFGFLCIEISMLVLAVVYYLVERLKKK